ncbi:MAG: response regulator transcription factor [Actinomycetota bacterium]|nr:response regulator transcription factor [Actinomycetota bacterium]
MASSWVRSASLFADGPSSSCDQDCLRVLVVDPEDIVVWGFKSLLFEEPWVDEVVGARDTTEALRLLTDFDPHLLIIDLELAGDHSSRFGERVRAQSPSTRILVTSSTGTLTPYAKAIGADGVIPKTWRAEAIAAALRTVGLGMSVFEIDSDGVNMLTERETSVLILIAGGATNKEVAAHLHLSSNTIKDHVRSLYRKLGARNRAEAVVRASALGLLGRERRANSSGR